MINRFSLILVTAALTLSSLGAVLAANLSDPEDFIDEVEGQYNTSRANYKSLLTDIADTKGRLEFLEEEAGTLKAQLSNLDIQVLIATQMLDTARKQVAAKENELKKLNNEVESLDWEIERHKTLLAEYLEMLYRQENAFFETENEQVNAFKILLTDGTVGDSLQELEFLNLLNEGARELIAMLENKQGTFDAKKVAVVEEQEELKDLRKNLEDNKKRLEAQRLSKVKLIEVTKGQEELYQALLAESLDQQETMVADIQRLSGAVNFVKERAQEEGENFDPEKYKYLLETTDYQAFEFSLANLGENAAQFTWPVEPNLGISAFFRYSADGYQATFGVAHNAIDLPVYQGSPVRSAADGVVFKTRDNGYGYSYVSVAHAGDLITNYGHVSKILVDEGQFVPAGAIIALSGGMPGTLGAGYMTTGPHLHFEVMKGGNYVDPMYYLPLGVLSSSTIERLPEKYRPLVIEALSTIEKVSEEQ